MEYNYSNAREISLKELFQYISIKWKKIIMIMAIISILVAGFCFVLYQCTGSEKIEEAKEQYTHKYDAYYAQINTLSNQIDNLQENKERQADYIQKSIKMNLDPLNLYVGTIQFYVSTNYQIMPDKIYQNIDKSIMILNGYANYINNGSMFQDIINELSYTTELRYLKEVVTANVDTGSRMINITINQSSEQNCKEIIDIITRLLKSKEKELKLTIDNHDLVEVDHALLTTVDFNLESYQKENIQKVSDLMTAIQESDEELTELKKEPVPEFKYDRIEILKDIIKKAIIGAILGLFLACFYFAFIFIVTGKLMTPSELKQLSSQELLAQYKKVYKLKLDRFIRKAFGILPETLSKEDKTKLVYETIHTAYNHNPQLEGAVLLVSTSNSEKTQQVIADLSQYSQTQPIKLIAGKDIETDVTTVKQLNDYNAVVIVEECEKSLKSDVISEVTLLTKLNKTILGSIAVEA